MMNLSELITSIKMDLGIYSVHIPVEDKDIYEVIKLRTLRTYSQYFPHITTVQLDVRELKKYEEGFRKTTVEIPNLFGDREIIQVLEVDMAPDNLNTGYMAPEMVNSMEGAQNLALSIAEMDLMSAMMPAFTFEFLPPNRLSLYNLSTYASVLDVRLGVEHFENLSTINSSAFEEFYQLALLDVTNYLYGILKHYKDLSTPFGNISLQIDDWSDASSDRRELVREWKSKSHLDVFDIYIH